MTKNCLYISPSSGFEWKKSAHELCMKLEQQILPHLWHE